MLVLLAGLVLLVLAPAVVYPPFLMKVLAYALFACSFNLLLGYGGMLSFGHAAFYGAGSYMLAVAAKSWGLGAFSSVLLGGLSAACIGLLFGLVAIRRQGIYFSMITLALAQMLFFVCLQAPFTGGEDGLQGVPRGKLFGLIDLTSDLTMYYVTLVIVVLAFLLIVRTIHSPFGQVLKAIKENEPRATSLGYDVARFKLLAFVISAALTGLAGSLKTVVLGFATLSDVHWTTSGHVILMTLMGGLGTLSGPILGSAVVVMLENKIGEFGSFLQRLTGVEWFSTLGESVTIVTGLIFVVCVLLFRKGIMGELIAWLQKKRTP
jgi:branched-chain amino acid transport system permease protein